MTNRVKGEVSPKGCTAESQGMRPSPLPTLVILGPEAENGHAQVGVALDRNKQGIAGSRSRSRLPSEEKLPRDNPTAEVAVADREPELVEAEALVLAAVALALVAFAFAVKTTSWLGVTAGGWNALNEGSDAPPADGVTPPPREHLPGRRQRGCRSPGC